ncbi:DnaJ domain-containing protein [Usnea florida]
MITRLSSLVLGAVLLSSPFVQSISPSEIPSDTPIASLVSSAKSHLAQGNANDALTYFDVAISRDPRNYLTIFQRGATYLSLGKNDKANQDFDRVLSIRPDFEGALLQRAKIKSRSADWEAAREDYVRAKKTESADFAQLEEAWGAASLASDAEKAGDWESCVGHAGTAIMVASTALTLRQLRARCRFERGEVLEGVSDLAHALQISPSAIEPHMQISTMMFYSMADTEKGVEQMRKCLRSDPDSKTCSKLFKREKQIVKVLKQASGLKEKRQFNSAVKLLVGTAEDPGLMQDVRGDVKDFKEVGYIHKNSPDDLYSSLVEMACECYTEINKKKAAPYCDEALTLNAHSLPGLVAQAHSQLDAEDFEAAIGTLNLAKEHHPAAQNVQSLLQKAHTLLKRSKTKDYYKVLSVPTDADDRTIKKAYRTMTKKYHPDKASSLGVTEEQAAKKMADINEAYEVLSDPELRARFDRGDDPNNPEQQGQPFHGSPFGQGPGGQQFFFRQGGGGGGGFKFQGGGGGGFQFPGGFGF